MGLSQGRDSRGFYRVRQAHNQRTPVTAPTLARVLFPEHGPVGAVRLSREVTADAEG